ncbi:MAG: hypothetical protein KF734_05825 [Saprospiraceae bacterium]|nr:hypothetical protein [Saprospiraceae bacterium]
MKQHLFCLVLFLIHFSANAQPLKGATIESNNAIYLTVLGEGIMSAHYNRVLFSRNKFFVDGKIGVGITSSDIKLGEMGGNGSAAPTFSHSISANIGARHCLEVGVGGFYAHSPKHKNMYVPYPIVGYKYRAVSTKFTLRLAVHPYLTPAPHTFGESPIPVGASLGFMF